MLHRNSLDNLGFSSWPLKYRERDTALQRNRENSVELLEALPWAAEEIMLHLKPPVVVCRVHGNAGEALTGRSNRGNPSPG